LKTALFSIFGVTLKRAKMKALTRANSRETSSGVRKRHFLALDEISVRLKNVQMVFGSFATFFILLGGLILTHMSSLFVVSRCTRRDQIIWVVTLNCINNRTTASHLLSW